MTVAELPEMAATRNTSSAIPNPHRAPPLNASLRELYPTECFTSSFLRYREDGSLDEEQSDFYFRHCQPADLPMIRALHKEWFPLDYGETFLTSTVSGECFSLAAVWKGRPQRRQGRESSESYSSTRSRAANCASAIASFFGGGSSNVAASSTEFDDSKELIVGLAVLSFNFPIAKNDLLMIVKYWALQRLLGSPMPKSEYDCLVELAGTAQEAQRLRHKYYNDLLWEYVRNSEEEGVASLRGVVSYILTLGTIEEVRGKGLASEMLQQVKAQISHRGLKVLMLHVATYNEAAIRVYKKNGFHVVSYTEVSKLYFLSIWCHQNFYEIFEEPYHAFLAVWISNVHCPVFDDAIAAAVDWTHAISLTDPTRAAPWR
eukprot:Blabericola_migrator_1__4927@NODE_256_length_10795_cov_202_211130_g214_i0_p3_GENE_NODE_256_length_10795_cov_202_211130_g214_i0NODE_256_length_10795_cov_202_211130_g214_i0_p3_ORF_typecomplete_len374_score18_72Acetyltransf_1/PF00583_25/2_8e12FR47/PF08445_10/1_1e11Acetyltransf_10/PF13673_7/9_2e09Acetyltransf_7/PF13508_7/3_3e08Acetyltransf_4/PF13420_7/8_5e03Acetyltransf_4/PF13420_7/2_9e07Acetyltransf_3/PF13302_7/4_8e07GNAT_acetyltran/PF12746_7/1_3e06Acetyltransf_9/PF13527_7/1_5e03Acetyltransf_9/PF13